MAESRSDSSHVRPECLWEQTYTGSRPVGGSRAVHEVEYVVRDLFSSHGVKVRDIRAALVYAIDVFDGEEVEKYYLHVVVRGVPWVRHMEDILDGSSADHVLTFSSLQENAVGESLRFAYARLHTLYNSPMEGSGVRLVLYTRVSEDTVERKVLRSRDDVLGYCAGNYVCEGYLPQERGGLKGNGSYPSGKSRRYGRRRATVSGALAGSSKRHRTPSDDEADGTPRMCFSDRVSRFKYLKLEDGTSCWK